MATEVDLTDDELEILAHKKSKHWANVETRLREARIRGDKTTSEIRSNIEKEPDANAAIMLREIAIAEEAR